MADVKKVAGITLCKPSSGPDGWHGQFHLRAGGLDIAVMQRRGENNLHSHPDTDSIWVVLAGKVNFYGENDTFVGEICAGEGVAIPRGVPYWFESVSEEELQIYHITARDFSSKGIHRINYAERERAAGRGPAPFDPFYPNHTERTATEEDRVAVARLLESDG